MHSADRDLFKRFRDGAITFHQLRARAAEKNQNFKYQVLDDIIHKLDPSIIGDPKESRRMYKLKFGNKASNDIPSCFNKY